MNKSEVKEIVKSEVKNVLSSNLDGEMKNILKRSSSDSRKELIQIIKDAMEAVYKVLWMKRDFWKSDIK